MRYAFPGARLAKMKCRGFVVHCYADSRKDRLYLVGRLEDGRSFAAAERNWRPSFHIDEDDRTRAEQVLAGTSFLVCPAELEAFDGAKKLLQLKFLSYRDFNSAVRIMENAGIPSPDYDLKIPDAYMIRHNIRGYIELDGETRSGRLVDAVFPEANIRSIEAFRVELKIASVDIETDTENGTIIAIGMSSCENNLVRVLGRHASAKEGLIFHSSEASMLEAFLEDIRKLDPDVITGWNFLDFDYPRLAERCAINHIPFSIGRSEEDAKFFPSSDGPGFNRNGQKNEGPGNERSPNLRRSAAALVQGRQVLDALRVYRAGPRGGRWDSSSYTLESVAMSILGKGKLIASGGEEKIEELKTLYRADPALFGEYCLRDAQLVLEILQRTGLFRLTVERATLTGVSLDKAWTSVASFERVYGTELHRKGIAPPPFDPLRFVSGAAGGTVLEPMTGLFQNVAIFDFRSLYPTIMLTFNIDPLAFARPDGGAKKITAPNGAEFSGERGVLPGLISEYFASRRRALEAGDEEASYVYKILMNSFYGVLGTPSCRYGRTELAGAITSFARKWLFFSRDWFTKKGFRVLYGDTDSLFVETGLGDGANYASFLEWGKGQAALLNADLCEAVRIEYALESHMELRFEKPYRRFLIPPLRGIAGNGRGRAKGYGGYLLDSEGGLCVEVKGMEAVRSDYTPLARRMQVELLELVFSGSDEIAFTEYVRKILREMRQGKLDGELVYRKRLARAPETYTASTPPQVKAARALGWKNRRGAIEYLWTINGPEPLVVKKGRPLPHAPLDYDHYAASQAFPMARSIAAAAGWNTEEFTLHGRGKFQDGQPELMF